MVQLTDVLGTAGVDEACGLSTVGDIGELVVEEIVLDVRLASLPLKGEREGEDDKDRRRFENQVEHLVEVDTLLLGEATKQPTCFVAVEGAIGLEVVAKDPLGGDDVSVPRWRHEIPSVVAEKSAVLRGHGIESVGILKRSMS
jgi:hypothetical protein